MADRRTERMAGYIRREHANSFAVDTGGWKDMFSNKRKQNDRRLQELSRQNVLEVMSQAVAQLQEQVKALNRGQAAQGRSLAQEMGTIDELEEQVREMKVQHNKLKVNVLGPQMHELQELQQFVKEQRAFNKQSALTIDAMKDLILKNIR